MTTFTQRRPAALTTAATARPGPGRRLLDYLALYAQRRALAQLDDVALEDIGVSRDAALEEAERPLWDVPAHWRG